MPFDVDQVVNEVKTKLRTIKSNNLPGVMYSTNVDKDYILAQIPDIIDQAFRQASTLMEKKYLYNRLAVLLDPNLIHTNLEYKGETNNIWLRQDLGCAPFNSLQRYNTTIIDQLAYTPKEVLIDQYTLWNKIENKRQIIGQLPDSKVSKELFQLVQQRDSLSPALFFLFSEWRISQRYPSLFRYLAQTIFLFVATPFVILMATGGAVYWLSVLMKILEAVADITLEFASFHNYFDKKRNIKIIILYWKTFLLPRKINF